MVYLHNKKLLKIKHSFYSRAPHHTAYEAAGKPVMPSQFIAKLQLKFLPKLVEHDMTDPVHAVLFTSGI